MSQDALRIVILAGPNGAGKSTAAVRLLRGVRKVDEFVNADTIARGLSALRPEGVAFLAGRIMLDRIRSLAKQRVSFAIETTLATRTYAHWLRKMIANSYAIDLIYLWLSSPELALARVADRVRRGGHSIPEDVIRRRYLRGLGNFFEISQPLAEQWTVYNNSGTEPVLVACGQGTMESSTCDPTTWQTIQRLGHGT